MLMIPGKDTLSVPSPPKKISQQTDVLDPPQLPPAAFPQGPQITPHQNALQTPPKELPQAKKSPPLCSRNAAFPALT